MARFDNGIAWYEIGTVTLRVAFPEGGSLHAGGVRICAQTRRADGISAV